MAEWGNEFETILDTLSQEMSRSGLHGLLHAMVSSWKNEDDCLVWITKVPGGNIFGSEVLFVNDKVLNKLQWSFSEWKDGTAPQNVFTDKEGALIKLHLDAKSSLPLLSRVRRKNLPQNQEGEVYLLHFHFDLPHDLRITVGVPA